MNIKQRLRPTILFSLFTLMTGCSGLPQTPLGINQQRLSPCPTADNCVTSNKSDPKHYLPAWAAEQSAKKTKLKLINILQRHPNIKIIFHSKFYIHAQYRSDWFGFVDDLEFLIEEKTVQIRSASRLGYSDFGANQKHLLTIQESFYGP